MNRAGAGRGSVRRGRLAILGAEFRVKKLRIFPIVLAAGGSGGLAVHKPLARFGGKTALAIALENCRELEPAIVVLGSGSARVRKEVPAGARAVTNRRWRSGQLSSLLAGLRHVPPGAPFLIYPVDHPLLTRAIVRRLVAGFRSRSPHEKIVLPRARGRAGHPTIFSGELRGEFAQARTAREVVYRDPARIRTVRVRSSAIWEDYGSPSAYRRLSRKFRARRGHRTK
jgi:molybdenum cofactor cytidylyltransferase